MSRLQLITVLSVAVFAAVAATPQPAITPPSVTFKGVRWNVTTTENLIACIGDDGVTAAQCYGLTHCDASHHVEIYVGRGLEQAQETYFHELSHVATACADTKATTLHDAIYTLAPAMSELLRENPKAAEYLVQGGAK